MQQTSEIPKSGSGIAELRELVRERADEIDRLDPRPRGLLGRVKYVFFRPSLSLDNDPVLHWLRDIVFRNDPGGYILTPRRYSGQVSLRSGNKGEEIKIEVVEDRDVAGAIPRDLVRGRIILGEVRRSQNLIVSPDRSPAHRINIPIGDNEAEHYIDLLRSGRLRSPNQPLAKKKS